jgi:hypothetical protein
LPHDVLRREWPNRRESEALAYRLVDRGVTRVFPLAGCAGAQVVSCGGIGGVVLAVIEEWEKQLHLGAGDC